MNLDKKPFALLVACSLAVSAHAGEREELLKLKNTTVNLIDILVQQGIIDKNKAESMIKDAETKASEEARRQMDAEKSEVASSVKGHTKDKSAKEPVRVTYVPDFVKDEIRQEVRKELRDDVVQEVKAHAKQEKWGIPAALPDWVNRIRWTGDMRLRYEDDFYGTDNQQNSYFDWPRINNQGGITKVDDPFRNNTVDRIRYRLRLRLGMEADVAEGLVAGLRLSTSNDRSPVSTNQTMGQYGQQYQVSLDRAYLQYDYKDSAGTHWLSMSGGRFANPWLSSDNLYYTDVSFEGFSGTLHLPFGGKASDPTRGQLAPQQINLGVSNPNEVFMTLGYFPLQEIELSSRDKWMWGGQTGLDWVFVDDVRMRTGIGYYDFNNIQALPNSLGSRQNDWSAPMFFTKGNSLARISNDGDVNQEPRLVGLASDFNILDAVFTMDYRAIGSTHVLFTGNYSRNLGFNQAQILGRTGENITPQVNAWQVRMDVGNPDIRKFADWNIWLAYKYLERDSVLDAYTDSNFHLGGTDTKGWHLSGSYGLARNTWLNVRWLATKAISGPPFDSDVLLVDLNSRF